MTAGPIRARVAWCAHGGRSGFRDASAAEVVSYGSRPCSSGDTVAPVTKGRAGGGDDSTVDARGGRAEALDATAGDMRAATPVDRAQPEMIGRFSIRRELGAGGMGVVQLAHDSTLDRLVAIKLLHAGDASETARVRMLREAQAMAR